MKYEGTYYLPKPVKDAFLRRATGEEPGIPVDGRKTLSIWAHLSSETGEQALYMYEVELEDDADGWLFEQAVYASQGEIEKEVFFSRESLQSLENIRILAGEDEFVIHLEEFMSDYDLSEHKYLTDVLRVQDLNGYPYPERSVMEDIVDKWYQGRYRKFVHANTLYHERYLKECERTKTGRIKDDAFDKWLRSNNIPKEALKLQTVHRTMRGETWSIRDMIYEDSEYREDDMLSRLYFGLMHDIFQMERAHFRRTDHREQLKRSLSAWHSRYQTYFGTDTEVRRGIWLPFPLCLSDTEYVHGREPRKLDSQIETEDLLSDEELKALICGYEILAKQEDLIAKTFIR